MLYELELFLVTLTVDNGMNEYLGMTLPALLIKTMDLIKSLQIRARIATR